MAVYRSFVFLLSLHLFLSTSNARNPTETNNTDCSCGYYDRSSRELFTESIIVYFNETDIVPDESFQIRDYNNGYEKGWNTRFRTGASPSNVDVGNLTDSSSFPQSLNLYVDPTTSDHLVVGGGIRSVRSDIHYGSFRTYLRSPRSWHPGSALSMVFHFNDSQQFTMDLLNTDSWDQAWVSMLVANEFPDRDLGANYTTIQNNTFSPWDYTEYKVDWTKDYITWFIDGKPYRNRTRKEDPWLPSAPVPIELKHWSTGNSFSMQGPPTSRSVANVGWMRLFFNSTTGTEADEKTFALNCKVSDACSVDDMQLRGSTPYSEAATVKWKQIHPKEVRRTIALIFCIACISITALLLAHSFAKRIPRRKTPTVGETRRPRNTFFPGSREHLTLDEASISQFSLPFTPAGLRSPEVASLVSPPGTCYNRSRAPSTGSRYQRRDLGDDLAPPMPIKDPSDDLGIRPISDDTTIREIHLHLSSIYSDSETLRGSRLQSGDTEKYPFPERYSSGISERVPSGYFDSKPVVNAQGKPTLVGLGSLPDDEITPVLSPATRETTSLAKTIEKHDFADEKLDFAHKNLETANKTGTAILPASNTPFTENAKDTIAVAAPLFSAPFDHAPAPNPTGLLQPRKRVEYLAGLVALSSVLITTTNFALTFFPAAITPGAFEHYSSEGWARKTIDPYLLNLIWIGPFLMTTTRYLVDSYLETGSLLAIAEKAVGRPFRLMIPVMAIVLIEYFLMDCGATTWLENLASVTWSTWPFTVGFNNFGNFLSETLQLMYLIPNAAPQITFNFCTGVLWLIPVQLQGSWTALLGVLVIREIKTPYKRFLYYAICILLSWYALLWSSYFYLAILLTDLDLTYNWRKYLHAHPFTYYPLLLLLAFLGLGGLTNDLVTQWTLVNTSSYEYGIHPDPPTGLPIMFTGAAGYPDYFVPKLNGLLFSFGIQALIELSPVLQRLFSFKLLQYIVPHIFTMYLVHGFIFWSLGATICVFLATRGFPYWLNVLLVAICCYAVLIYCLSFLSPVVETLGERFTSNIWRFSHEKPAPRRPTLFPFPADLFLRCTGNEEIGKGTHETHDTVSRDAAGRLSFEGRPVVPVLTATESGHVRTKVVVGGSGDGDGEESTGENSRFSHSTVG